MTFKNQYQRGFFGTIIGLIIMVTLVAGLVYFLSIRPISFGNQAGQQPTTTVAPLSTPSAENSSVTATTTKTYSTTVEASYEGTWHITFAFDYPTKAFTIEPIQDKGVQLSETATSSVHTITASYEGARGYSPKDYWTNILKKDCTGCTATTTPLVAITGSSTSLTYQNKTKIVQVSTVPSSNNWLMIFTVEKPIDTIEGVLSTFRVTDAN